MNPRILDIILVHAIVLVIQFLFRRYTSMPKFGIAALYFILMPQAFIWLGWDVGGWGTAPIVLLGVAALFFGMRRPPAPGDAA